MFTTRDSLTMEVLFTGLEESTVLYAIRYRHAWENKRSALVVDESTGEVVYEQ